jgi:aspartate aminotransferase-like enzyme
MQTYKIPLVPGPVSIPPSVLKAYHMDYGSSDLESEFFDLYMSCERTLQILLGTQNDVPIQVGEGMLALWGAMKSVLQPSDRVLAVSTGLFGAGFGTMAQQLGAEVELLDFGNNGVADPQRVREAALRMHPKLITLVHCETPSGTLNPLREIGEICREVDALYCVDFVASAGGVPVEVDACYIDLGLLGSQKVLSLMPDLAMVSVSQRAWQVIEDVGYVGYDALLPWRNAIQDRYMPYTHNWHALAGLHAALELLLEEGLDNTYQRHASVARYCRERLKAMGVELFPADESHSSPTVTAAHVPEGWTWQELDGALREREMVVGGNYGPLAGKVFRIGHMGYQARMDLVEQGMDVLEEVLTG